MNTSNYIVIHIYIQYIYINGHILIYRLVIPEKMSVENEEKLKLAQNVSSNTENLRTTS